MPSAARALLVAGYATHVKLAYGDNLADLAPLVAWIGTTRIEVLAVR